MKTQKNYLAVLLCIIALFISSCCTTQPQPYNRNDNDAFFVPEKMYSLVDTTQISTTKRPITELPGTTIQRPHSLIPTTRPQIKRFALGDYQKELRYALVYCTQEVIDSLKLNEFAKIVKVTATDSSGVTTVTKNSWYFFIHESYDFDQVIIYLRGIEYDFNALHRSRNKQRSYYAQ